MSGAGRGAVLLLAVFLPSLRPVIRAVDGLVDRVRPPGGCGLTEPLTADERRVFEAEQRSAA